MMIMAAIKDKDKYLELCIELKTVKNYRLKGEKIAFYFFPLTKPNLTLDEVSLNSRSFY